MNLEQWGRVADWHDSVRDALSQLLPSASGSEANAETLAALRSRIMDAFEELRSGMLGNLAPREVNQFLLPLVLLTDEKVLTRIRPTDRASWPLLQHELYSVENGGDLFYELIDEQLSPTSSGTNIGEILLFCLSDGFRGRHGDAPARLQTYRTKLAAKLGLNEPPVLPVAVEVGPAPEDIAILEPPSTLRKVFFYGATAAAIIAMPFLFVWLSNFFSVGG